MKPETQSSTTDPLSLAPLPHADRSALASQQDDSSRCHHRYPNGKRCRLPAAPSQSGLCALHFRFPAPAGLALLPSPSDFEDLSADLLPESEGSTPISKFLSRLLVLVTKGRITPRRAAVLAYLTNQLAHSPRSAAAPPQRKP